MFKKRKKTPGQDFYTWGEDFPERMLTLIREDDDALHDRIAYNIRCEYDVSVPGTAEAVLIKLAEVHDMEFLDSPALDESLLVNAIDIVSYLHLVQDGTIEENQSIEDHILRRKKHEDELLPIIYAPDCDTFSTYFSVVLSSYRAENYEEFKVSEIKKPSWITRLVSQTGIFGVIFLILAAIGILEAIAVAVYG